MPAQPFPTNTTCDIYRTGTGPPATPAVAAVPCLLPANYQKRSEGGEGDATALRYTHTLEVPYDTDVRDSLSNFTAGGTADTVYVPDKNGTGIRVICVQILDHGLPTKRKRVYADRLKPTYPTV